jgi:hypothetical protein
MWSLIESARLFLWGLIRRFYFWVFALFFDPFGVLKEWFTAYADYMSIPTFGALTLFLGLLFWCAILTYHELRIRTLERYPNVPIERVFHYLRTQTTFGADIEDDGDFLIAAEREIGDQVRIGRFVLWGRPADPLGELGRRHPIRADTFDEVEIDLTRLVEPDVCSATTRPRSSHLNQAFCLEANEEAMRAIWPTKLWLSLWLKKKRWLNKNLDQVLSTKIVSNLHATSNRNA